VRAAVSCLLLAGCIDIPPSADPCDHGEDVDQDGWTCDGAAPDCDDTDPDRYPGNLAEEFLDDLDCDGVARATLTGITIDSADSLVSTGDAVLSFGDGPVDVLEDGVSILSDSTEEGGLGLAMYPTWVSGRDGGVGTGQLDSDAPVMAHIAQPVWIDLDGPTFIGQVHWFVYPGGRVIRNDHDLELNAPLPDETFNYFVSSYASFDAFRFGFVRSSASAGMIPVPNPPKATTFPITLDAGMQDWVCLYNDFEHRAVTASWLPRGGDGPRVTFGDDGRLALEHDWHRDESGAIPAGRYDAVTLLQLDLGDAADDCVDAAEVTAAFQRPAAVTVTPPGRPIATLLSDAGGDAYWETQGTYAVDSGGGGFVELTFDEAARDVVIRGRFDGSLDVGYTVWLDDERLRRGHDFLASTKQGFAVTIEAVVWIPGPIPAGSTVRIASPGDER
jgi:hypothetical protein